MLFFFFTMQEIIIFSGFPSFLKNVILSAERAVLAYREAIMKNNWQMNVRKNFYFLSKKQYKFYFVWTKISQCWFPKNFNLHIRIFWNLCLLKRKDNEICYFVNTYQQSCHSQSINYLLGWKGNIWIWMKKSLFWIMQMSILKWVVENQLNNFQ